MPNRILKESICTSDNIDQLSAFQETVFYRLIVNCDDYGRFDGRPKIIASKLFPLKDIRSNQIEDALRALTSAELVTLYMVDGKPFLQMNTWDRHQTIRAKKSKYPSPDEGVKASANNCKQMQADANKCSRNPIQSESNPNPIRDIRADAQSARTGERNFDKLWSVYPRHEGKQAALKAFEKIDPDDELLERMINAIMAQKKSAQWADPQFIPHPATWLNGHRWEDEPTKAAPQSKRVLAQQYEQRDYNEKEMQDKLGVYDVYLTDEEYKAKYGRSRQMGGAL